MSSNPEALNYEVVTLLDSTEIDNFTAKNIWPAAEHFWKGDFRDTEKVKELKDKEHYFTSPDGENSIVIRMYVDLYHELDEKEELYPDGRAQLSVGINMDVYRADVTELYQRVMKSDELIWEVVDYEFPTGDSIPDIRREYIMTDSAGGSLGGLSLQQHNFIKKISKTRAYKLPDQERLTSQDAIDIHNMLLAIKVPETAISLV